MSEISKLRAIADSDDFSFRGSNRKEQKAINKIRKEFAPYLYSDPPKSVLKKLRPFLKVLECDYLNEIAGMY